MDRRPKVVSGNLRRRWGVIEANDEYQIIADARTFAIAFWRGLFEHAPTDGLTCVPRTQPRRWPGAASSRNRSPSLLGGVAVLIPSASRFVGGAGPAAPQGRHRGRHPRHHARRPPGGRRPAAVPRHRRAVRCLEQVRRRCPSWCGVLRRTPDGAVEATRTSSARTRVVSWNFPPPPETSAAPATKAPSSSTAASPIPPAPARAGSTCSDGESRRHLTARSGVTFQNFQSGRADQVPVS